MNIKKMLIVLSLVVLILTTGCIKFEMDIKVNRDNSADINVLLLMNTLLQGSSEINDTLNIDEIKAEAERSGFTATSQKEGDMSGYKFTKHVKNIKELSADSTSSMKLDQLFQDSDSEMQIFTMEKGILKNTYTVHLPMDFDKMNPSKDSNEPADAITKAILDQMDFKFKMTLPIKTESNNATVVSADGKTMEWKLNPGEKNTIMIIFKVWSIPNIVIILAVLLAVVLLIVLLSVSRRNRKETIPEIVDHQEGQIQQ